MRERFFFEGSLSSTAASLGGSLRFARFFGSPSLHAAIVLLVASSSSTCKIFRPDG